MANFTGQLWSLLDRLKVVTFKSALIVGPGIEEIFAHRGTFLTGVGFYNGVNDANGVNHLFQFIGDEDRAELLTLDPERHPSCFCLFESGEDGVRGTEVFLPFYFDLFALSDGFPQVPIGSTIASKK